MRVHHGGKGEYVAHYPDCDGGLGELVTTLAGPAAASVFELHDKGWSHTNPGGDGNVAINLVAAGWPAEARKAALAEAWDLACLIVRESRADIERVAADLVAAPGMTLSGEEIQDLTGHPRLSPNARMGVRELERLRERPARPAAAPPPRVSEAELRARREAERAVRGEPTTRQPATRRPVAATAAATPAVSPSYMDYVRRELAG
jgi:hypothetical protein